MKKIVVGIDGSEQSKRALGFAIEEGKLRGVAVVAVHAWELPAPPVDARLVPAPLDYPALIAELSQEAEQLLKRVVEHAAGAKGDGAPVERLVVEGPAVTALLDVASGAGMVVVGSHGRGGVARLLLGSVSEQIARRAPCPVLIHRSEGRCD